MILKRRDPPCWSERVRVWVWPRHSWSRSLRYVALRMMRMRAAPHEVALGCAIGVFAAMTPLIGFQMIVAGILAYALRANLAAAMLGTFFGNPLTWPVIWPATYAAGCAMVGVSGALDIGELQAQFASFSGAVGRFSPELLTVAAEILWPFVKLMLLGSLPIGLLISAIFYYVSRRAAASFHARRSAQLAAALNVYSQSSLVSPHGSRI